MAGKKARTKARKAEEATTLSNTAETKARGPFSSEASSHQFKPSVLSKTKPKPGQAGDTFDVFMLKEAPGKGLGAFATQPIKCGATVYSEKPLVIIEKPPDDFTEQDICEAYVKLTPHEQRVFNGMRNRHEGKGCQCKTGRFFSSIFNLEDAWRRTGCFPICSRFNHSCRPTSPARW
ncbi:hypothetical protein Slin15195_G082450 [Septoria linicola]|uniref:SET domain-containing protein n=1 Tax=Septoria linicola TaxID=215465 RepID=A0A9Q9B222_9PEZI|nr:hypothetical protein Slin15195_G082450 [Septoria linicola]